MLKTPDKRGFEEELICLKLSGVGVFDFADDVLVLAQFLGVIIRR